MKKTAAVAPSQATVAEDALRRVVDTTPALIHTGRLDGYLDYFDKGWLDFLGKSLEEVCGWRWTDLIHPEDVAGIVQRWHTALASGEPFEDEARVRRADGTYRTFLHRKAPLRDEHGNIVKWFGSSIDIEDRKRAEAAPPLEAQLQATLNVIPAHTWYAAPSGSLTFVNKRCANYLGLPKDHPLCLGIDTDAEWDSPIPFLHADDHEEARRVWSTCLRTGCAGEVSVRVRNAQGGYRWFLGRFEPLRASDGTLLYWVGVNLDIEERKRAEEELRNSERRYRHLVDTTPAFVHTALPNGEVDFYNRGWLEYVGLPLTDLLGWGWTCMIHPEDVETIVPKWRAALEAGEPFIGESRVRRADGEYRWFLHREEPLRNAAGEIVKWYGSSIEIEERKIAEETIREQEIELRQILDLTPQHIAVFGPDGERLFINQTALEYYGVTIDELRAEVARPEAAYSWLESRLDLVHPEDREHFLSERKKGFLEGRPFEFEARVLRHDGAFRCFLSRLTPIRDERGQIIRWYGTATDIEDRKQAEEEIRRENIALREELGKTSMFEEVIGTSSALQMALARAAKVAPTESTVLILGETGTGKELIARAIHRRSKRPERPFISVNCAAIPASLIMSELFGHEKGAFTGALQRRLGRFELAEGGTLFLDEVGDLPLETQIALLRVLQEREFERVGGSEVLRADVRVIAATNCDLQAAIADGAFRSDLYYRLNVFPITLPPLRERREDVPLLVNYFVDRFSKRAGKKIKHIQKKALEVLQEYSWPGNVRELQNVIERSLIITDTNEFSIDKSWVANEPQPRAPAIDQTLNERKRVEAALAQSNGKVSGANGAAARLGMPASTLESKIRALRINKFQFRGV
jgi:PAS domain S-box-containing protein